MELKSFFSPPVFDGKDEKKHKEIILNASLWTVIALLIIAPIGTFAGGDTPPFIIALSVICLLLCLGAQYALQKGWGDYTLIGICALIIGTIHITAIIIALGTLHAPITMAYALIIIIASLEFEKKGVIVTTTGILLILLEFLFTEHNSLLTPPNRTTALTHWGAYASFLILIGTLSLFVSATAKRSLLYAQTEFNRRKKNEDKLQLLTSCIELSPASIIIVDADGFILEANSKFLKTTGYTIDEVRGKKPSILKSGLHTEEFYKTLWDTISSGKEWHGEFHNRKKNGELYWEKASIAPIFNEANKITHYIAIKEDITTEKNAREAQKKLNLQLQAKLKEVNELQVTLRRQATRDPLTGLYNRRYMEDALEREFSRAKRNHTPLSIILLDLDFLKKLNDTGGHAIGDYALRSLAGLLNASTRREDTVCRYGGDEFAVILPDTTGENALTRAEKWRKKMADITLLHRDNQVLKITFTAGIATYPEHGETIKEIFSYADVALYRAKLKGRNCIELFSKNSP